MIRYDRTDRLLATILSGLAGYVDAVGFIALGGFFVSFMSGNSTRLGVGIAHGVPQAATTAALLIATFVVGVVVGSLCGRAARARHRPAVLTLVAALLLAAALLGVTGHIGPAVSAMVLAMGAENAVFEADGDVQIGLTYMTGTLVKAGQRLTTALLGGAPYEWVPYVLLWLGLATGAVIGAAAYGRFGLGALFFASATAAGCAMVAGRR